MAAGEEPLVFALVERVFNEFVRSDFTPEGIEEFFRSARSFIFDHPADHTIIVALAQGRVVGIIDLKDNQHISLFFVDSTCRSRGIGRALLHHAMDLASRRAPDNSAIDVNSSLYAVPVYEKLGFRRTGPEQTVNGIRFVNMVLSMELSRLG